MTEQEYNQALIDRNYHKAGLNKANRIIDKYERNQRKERERLEAQPAIEKAKELIEQYNLKQKLTREIKAQRQALMHWLCIYTPMKQNEVAELFDMSLATVTHAMRQAYSDKPLRESAKAIIEQMNEYKCSQSSK